MTTHAHTLTVNRLKQLIDDALQVLDFELAERLEQQEEAGETVESNAVEAFNQHARPLIAHAWAIPQLVEAIQALTKELRDAGWILRSGRSMNAQRNIRDQILDRAQAALRAVEERTP